VKELCEGISFNKSLETLASLLRGFDILHARIEKVCVWSQEPPKGNLRHQGDQVVIFYFQLI
jgi:hypothetical protein